MPTLAQKVANKKKSQSLNTSKDPNDEGSSEGALGSLPMMDFSKTIDEMISDNINSLILTKVFCKESFFIDGTQIFGIKKLKVIPNLLTKGFGTERFGENLTVILISKK